MLHQEQLLQRLFDSVSLGIAVITTDGTISYVNKFWDEFSQNNKTLLSQLRFGVNYLSLYHQLAEEDQSAPTALSGIRAVVEGKQPEFIFEYPYQISGKQCWFVMRATSSQHKDGETIVTLSDITEHKQSEENLRLSEQHLRDLIDNLVCFVGLLTLDGTVIEVNRTALDSANLKPKDVLGKKFEDTYWWGWSEEVRQKLRDVIKRAAKGETLRHDMIIRIGENQFTTIDFQIAPIFDENDKVIQLVPSAIDISERLRLEVKLNQTEKLSLAGELAAGLAHEIKNPLTGIQGAIDILIQRQNHYSPEISILENVRREIVRIDNTVNLLLDRTRPRPMRFVQASLRETVRRTVQIADYQVAARQLKNKIKIVSDLPEDYFLLKHDVTHVEDAVLNLLINAVDAIGKQSGQITVRLYKAQTAAHNQEAVIEITDTGCGISEADLANLFTPFYTTKEFGTGLGLSAVKRTAAAHEGFCAANSTIGQGSIFTLHLPIKL